MTSYDKLIYTGILKEKVTYSTHHNSLHFYQEGKGVDTLGGLPPPQAPPGGIVPITL